LHSESGGFEADGMEEIIEGVGDLLVEAVELIARGINLGAGTGNAPASIQGSSNSVSAPATG